MDKVTEEMIQAGIESYEHGLGVYEIAEIVEAIYLAMHSKAVGEDEVERLMAVCKRSRESAIRALPNSPGKWSMDIDRAIVTDLLAAISAMGDRR